MSAETQKMTVADIEKKIEDLCNAMIEKGYSKPVVYVQVGSGFCHLSASTGRGAGQHISTGEFSEDYAKSLDKLEEYVEKMEDANEEKKRLAVKTFSEAVDELREAGFEAEFTDPLSDTLQQLSGGLLEYKPESEILL